MAYVMARTAHRLAKAATGWVVVSQAFPFVLVIIPLFLVLKNLHLINSLSGLIMVYVVWALPFALWMLAGYVRAVPARAGGGRGGRRRGHASRTLVSVTARCSPRGIVATALFAFITAWNEFFFALVLLKTPEKQTMPVDPHPLHRRGGRRRPRAARRGRVPGDPPRLVFFAIIQRRVTGGMLAGAVKG